MTGATGGTAGHVTLRHVSPGGEMGYPGTLTVDAVYSLSDDDRLGIEYRATTTAPTIVNITNHTYWNLSGEGSANGAMGHCVTIPGEAYLPTDAGAIPTGEVRAVAGTAFDFRTPRAVGERVRDASDEQLVFGRGYDHNWLVGGAVTAGEHLMAQVADACLGSRLRALVEPAGPAVLFGQFPRWDERRQGAAHLPGRRRARLRTADFSRHAEPAGVRLGPARARRDLSQCHDLPPQLGRGAVGGCAGSRLLGTAGGLSSRWTISRANRRLFPEVVMCDTNA